MARTGELCLENLGNLLSYPIAKSNQPEPYFPNTNHKEFRKKYERTYEFKQGQQRGFIELAKQQSLSRTKSISKLKSLSQIAKEKTHVTNNAEPNITKKSKKVVLMLGSTIQHPVIIT